MRAQGGSRGHSWAPDEMSVRRAPGAVRLSGCGSFSILRICRVGRSLGPSIILDPGTQRHCGQPEFLVLISSRSVSTASHLRNPSVKFDQGPREPHAPTTGYGRLILLVLLALVAWADAARCPACLLLASLTPSTHPPACTIGRRPMRLKTGDSQNNGSWSQPLPGCILHYAGWADWRPRGSAGPLSPLVMDTGERGQRRRG